MQDGSERAVGVELNGHVWDGVQWVPTPPERPDHARAGARQGPTSGASTAPPFHLWQQPLPQSSGFADPHYGYGFTRQTSDDLQFIARFIKVMIIIGIVLAIPAILFFVVTMGSLLAAIGSLGSHIPR